MKSSKVVDFPLENLDLREWLRDLDTKVQTKYNCFAIAVTSLPSDVLSILCFEWDICSSHAEHNRTIQVILTFPFRTIMVPWLQGTTLLMLRTVISGTASMIAGVR